MNLIILADKGCTSKRIVIRVFLCVTVCTYNRTRKKSLMSTILNHCQQTSVKIETNDEVSVFWFVIHPLTDRKQTSTQLKE